VHDAPFASQHFPPAPQVLPGQSLAPEHPQCFPPRHDGPPEVNDPHFVHIAM
jgi:hypothetical protein